MNKETHSESAEEVIFASNLEEFGAQVGLICSLESGDKITSAQAYQRIKDLWKQLKSSRKNLGIHANGAEGA